MAKLRRYLPTRPPLSLAFQNARMFALFPELKIAKRKGDSIAWKGSICPTLMAENYEVRVEYDLGHHPKVHVVSPTLRIRQGCERIPHTYSDGTLCLYDPLKNEWTPHKLLADHVIPWISLWLSFYEDWHITGKWLGGGTHPEKNYAV